MFTIIVHDAEKQTQEYSQYRAILRFQPEYSPEKGDYSEVSGPLPLGSSPAWESCPRMLDIGTRNYKHFVF